MKLARTAGIPWRASLALAVAVCCAAAPAPARDIPFEELGQAFVETRCPNGEKCTLPEVIEAAYGRVRLGAFQMCVPVTFLKEKARSKEVIVAGKAIVDVQQLWVERFCGDEAVVEQVTADAKTIRDWFDDWRYGDYSKLDREENKDFTVALKAPDEVLQALDRFAETVMSREKVGIAPQYTDVIQIVLAPDRRDFMEFVGFAGLQDAQTKKILWVDGVDQFTQFWIKRTLVLSMEYAAWGDADPNFRTGTPMTKVDKNGLMQHIVQQATRAMAFTCFNSNDLALLEKGLAVQFTITICGLANTIDGDGVISTTGASTAPYSKFVPGGNPAGGTLPAIPAAAFNMTLINHWRTGYGVDYFLKPLCKGQHDGAKRGTKDRDNPLRKDDRPHFALEGDTGAKTYVTAPFLGAIANKKQYPEADFMNDYREFYRSYQTCFLHWLEEHGDPESEKVSADKFRQLIVKMGTPGQPKLDDVALEVYGIPISAADGETDSIEWRFLDWLSKQ